MIRFACPACSVVMNCPDDKAGVKVGCPRCGQRLEIPPAPKGTMLGKPLPPRSRLPAEGATSQEQRTRSFVAPQSSAPIQPQSGPPATANPFDFTERQPPSLNTGLWVLRKWVMRVFGVASLVVLLLAAGWAVFWLCQRGSLPVLPGGADNGTSEPQLPSLQGGEKQLVLDYLQRNLNDPSGMEVVEWGESRSVLIANPRSLNDELWALAGKPLASKDRPAYKPGVIMHLKFRAKNGFGAKMLHGMDFLIQDGKVVKTHQDDDEVPANFGVLGVERTGGKLTRVLVRGKISYKGAPVRLMKAPDQDGLAVRFIRDRSEPSPWRNGGSGYDDVLGYGGGGIVDDPPDYEKPYLEPGKYFVTVAWLERNPAADSPRPRTPRQGPDSNDLNDPKAPKNPGAAEPAADARQAWQPEEVVEPVIDTLGGAYSNQKTPLVVDGTDAQEIQTFDIDLKADKVRNK